MNPALLLQNFYKTDLSRIFYAGVSRCALARFLRRMNSQIDRFVRNLKKTKDTLMFKKLLMTTALSIPLVFNGAASAQTGAKKPNIVVIMADDVGIWNVGAYHRGMMGGSTPNIDRIAKEGALFTDYYAQQSCTAGRAAFILGQTPFRTGLLKVGIPAAKQGLQDKD